MNKFEQIKQIDAFIELVSKLPYDMPLYTVIEYLHTEKRDIKASITVLDYLKSIHR